jgi:polyisoprenoid-binding protein YceI
MRRVLYGGVILAAVGFLIGAAVVVYILVSGGSGEASAPISAPELVAVDDDLITFRIVPEESSARFLIDEILRGQPTTAIGQTNQVAGDIAVDVENPANSQVGTIRVNVRTLETDNAFRDRAIRSRILMSARDEFEFAEFVPTAITGLPTSVTLSEHVELTVVGQLTLRDITKEVIFQTAVTPISQGRLEGTARATVLRSDFDLVIPQVPSVANVSDQVALEIDFVATAIE